MSPINPPMSRLTPMKERYAVYRDRSGTKAIGNKPAMIQQIGTRDRGTGTAIITKAARIPSVTFCDTTARKVMCAA
jgi:hypothetical protein